MARADLAQKYFQVSISGVLRACLRKYRILFLPSSRLTIPGLTLNGNLLLMIMFYVHYHFETEALREELRKIIKSTRSLVLKFTNIWGF